MASDAKIFIGTSGWSYDHWEERFYPRGMKKNEWFSYYAQHFHTVELNMSFYRYPFQNMLKGWQRKMPEDFRMTFKVNRQITHQKKFLHAEEALHRFYKMTETLGNQTGCILFQTPPSFPCDDQNFRTLLQFMDVIDVSHRNVFEFRHTSWWNPEVIKLLKAHKAAFCNVSGLGMPSEVNITSEVAYFRYHGPGKPYASEYTEEQLQAWARTISEIQQKHELKEIYCYFNNDYFGYAIKNAKRLYELMNA